MSKVATQAKHAQTNVRAESPLYHADLDSLAEQDLKGSVVLQEKKLLGHLILRGDAGNELFAQSIAKVLGASLPMEPLSSAESEQALIQWISPDEWLIVVDGGREAEVEAQLREQLKGHYSIVDVSGAQTILALSGPDAINVLKKSTPYDVHPRHFPVGKCVSTVFARGVPIQIRRAGEERWELVVRRSFADYIWMWLQDASAEYGLVIKR